jgi:hypothetical protein
MRQDRLNFYINSPPPDPCPDLHPPPAPAACAFGGHLHLRVQLSERAHSPSDFWRPFGLVPVLTDETGSCSSSLAILSNWSILMYPLLKRPDERVSLSFGWASFHFSFHILYKSLTWNHAFFLSYSTVIQINSTWSGLIIGGDLSVFSV